MRLDQIERDIDRPDATPFMIQAAEATVYAIARELAQNGLDDAEKVADSVASNAIGGGDPTFVNTAIKNAVSDSQQAERTGKSVAEEAAERLKRETAVAPEVASLRKEVDDLKAAMAVKDSKQQEFTTRFQKEAHELNDKLTKEFAQAAASRESMLTQLKAKFDSQESMLRLRFAEFESKIRKEIRDLLARKAAGHASGVRVDEQVAEDLAAIQERKDREEAAMREKLREVAAARRASAADVDAYLNKLRDGLTASGHNITAADEAVVAMGQQIESVKNSAALNETATTQMLERFNVMGLDDFLKEQEKLRTAQHDAHRMGVTRDFIKEANRLVDLGLLDSSEVRQLQRLLNLHHHDPTSNAAEFAQAQQMLITRATDEYKQKIQRAYEEYQKNSPIPSIVTPMFEWIRETIARMPMGYPPPEVPPGPPQAPAAPTPPTEPIQQPTTLPPQDTSHQAAIDSLQNRAPETQSAPQSATVPQAAPAQQQQQPPQFAGVPQPLGAQVDSSGNQTKGGVAGAPNASNIPQPLIAEEWNGQVVYVGQQATIPSMPPLNPAAEGLATAALQPSAAAGAGAGAAAQDKKAADDDEKKRADKEEANRQEARKGYQAWFARGTTPEPWTAWRTKFEPDPDIWQVFLSLVPGGKVDAAPPPTKDKDGNIKLPSSKPWKWADWVWEGSYSSAHPKAVWKSQADKVPSVRFQDPNAATPTLVLEGGSAMTRDQYFKWCQNMVASKGANVFLANWAPNGILAQGTAGDGAKGMYVGEDGTIITADAWPAYQNANKEATGVDYNPVKFGPPAQTGGGDPPPPNVPDAQALASIAENRRQMDEDIARNRRDPAMGWGKRRKRKQSADEKPHELDENEIAHHMSAYQRKGFRGVVAADEVHQMKQHAKGGAPVSFVMNTDKRKQGGRHWVAVHWQGPNLHYYDPFGKPPTKDMKRRFSDLVASDGKNGTVQLKVNRVPNQRGNSVTCGLHSMRFLQDMHRGRSFQQATNFNTKEGEEAARSLMKGADLPAFEYI